jgi:D-alanyl-D-alanine carboxypeptidase/D-alanyl-D-alanine-endopeptidase (penicillin-binding protein 4)
MPTSRPALLLVAALSLSGSVRAADPTAAPEPVAPPSLDAASAEVGGSTPAPVEATPPAIASLVGTRSEPVGLPEAVALVAPVIDPARLGRFIAGVHVVHLESGEEVYGWNADLPLMPASTMKVVTAATSLATLGPSYTFTTGVWRTGAVDDGVLDGDLVLVGGGDPTMTVERLWRLLREVRQDGVETVTGDLVFDDGFFDEPPVIPAWDSRRDMEEGPTYFPGISALELEFGQTGILVRPGPRIGAPAVVETEIPAGDYVKVDNGLVTGRSRSRSRVDLERVVGEGTLTFALDGVLSSGAAPLRFRRAVPDPTAFTMAAVHELLDDVGITVRGTLRRGALPKGSRLVERAWSPPLGSVLADMNKHSSNFIAETVVRTLGAEELGHGTTDAGLDVLRAHLDALGVDRETYRLANGSGLTRAARVPARLLTTVLRADGIDPKTGPELMSSLSIGGRDGTLRNRFDGAEGQVRGKTGTLADVHALAGYFEADDGEVYAFAFLANDVEGGVYQVKSTIDDFLTALFRLSRHPDAGGSPGLATDTRLR